MELTFLFILGLAIGSFLNVLIDRLPKEKSIFGRSHCDFCKKKLQAKDLIPIVSFLFLKGKCRYCHRKLSWQYPLVELLTGSVFVVILGSVATPESLSLTRFWTSQSDIVNMLYVGMLSCLIVIFFADWKYHVIPDQIQIGLLIFITGIVFFSGVSDPVLWLIRLRDGLLVMSPILAIYLVTKGKGMGFADVKFAFIIGFFLQIIYGLFAIYFGFIIGATFGLFLVFLRKKKMKDRIAFGPFLALGFTLMIMYGNQILDFAKKFYF